MGQKSKIEWTDRTWNPVTGCTKVSQGCKNCYAERLYERFNGKGSFKNVQERPERLKQPFAWKKPGMVFVNSMSDLFHEEVSFQFIIEVFHVMKENPQHTFQILTKRAKRMHEFFTECTYNPYGYPYEPLPNVWLGVSVENQAAMEERVPLLVDSQVPAVVKFLSCEPLLGPLQLPADANDGTTYVDWVIVGGESGPGARPMHPLWASSLRDQCREMGNVPFFFKQWGEYGTKFRTMGLEPKPTFRMYHDYQHFAHKDWVEKGDQCIDLNGKICKIGKDFMTAAYPVAIMNRVGKTKAGSILDGKEYKEFPKTINHE